MILPWFCRTKPILTLLLQHGFCSTAHIFPILDTCTQSGQDGFYAILRTGFLTSQQNPDWTFIYNCFLCYPIKVGHCALVWSGGGGHFTLGWEGAFYPRGGGGGGQFALVQNVLGAIVH